MSGTKTITNPNNVFGETSENSNYFDTEAEFLNTGAAAIVQGDAVALKYTVAGTLLECEAYDTDASGQSAFIGAGVAKEAIAVNATGRICIFGFAKVNVSANTPAKSNACIGTTTAGICNAVVADATTVATTVLGVFLGVKDANNRAPVWVSPR